MSQWITLLPQWAELKHIETKHWHLINQSRDFSSVSMSANISDMNPVYTPIPLYSLHVSVDFKSK